MKNNYDFKNEIEKQIKESIEPKKKISEKYVNVIASITEEIIKAYKNNKKVLWFGNGGSAADAQHLACEFVSRFAFDRAGLKSMALTTNTSILTAVSNDYNYDKVFERQVDTFAEKGDVLIGLSTSGNSTNVIKALKLGKKKSAITVAFVGKNIDKVKDFVDYIIPVPSSNTARIQESHIMVGHIICYLVEKSLFEEK